MPLNPYLSFSVDYSVDLRDGEGFADIPDSLGLTPFEHQLTDVCLPPNLGQVNEAEEERLRGEREHQRVTRLCQQAEARVQALQKTLRRAIGKSRPYFELKAQFSQILEVANGEDGQVERVLVCFFGQCRELTRVKPC